MDIKRVAIMVVLLGALAWAVTTSPLTKRLFGEPARRPVSVGALAPLGQQPAGAPTAGAPALATPTTPLSRDQVAQWRQEHGTAWRRDPFFTAEEERVLFGPKAAGAHTGPPPPPPPEYKVKAILIAGADKLAALDGRLVSEGEALGDERVVEIRPDSVVLERFGQRRRLSLPGGSTPITEIESRQREGRARP